MLVEDKDPGYLVLKPITMQRGNIMTSTDSIIEALAFTCPLTTCGGVSCNNFWTREDVATARTGFHMKTLAEQRQWAYDVLLTCYKQDDDSFHLSTKGIIFMLDLKFRLSILS